MQVFQVDGKKRTEAGKKYTKKIRKDGSVPCVLYGGSENIMFELNERSIKKLIYTDKVYIIELNLDGEIHRCIKKDSQFHPVTDNILHIDFLKIADDKLIKMYIPVKLNGFAIGVQAGGYLYQLKRYLHVRALPINLPDTIDLDITNLGLGKSLKISDLKYDNIEFIEHPSEVVAMIKLTRAAMSKADAEKEATK